MFHFASIPGGKAEAKYELGRIVNLHATKVLIGLLRAAGGGPVLVFANSIAALGGPLPPLVETARRRTRCCPTARRS